MICYWMWLQITLWLIIKSPVFYRTLILSLSKVVMIKTSTISDFKIRFVFGYTYYCTLLDKVTARTCNVESKKPFHVALNYKKSLSLRPLEYGLTKPYSWNNFKKILVFC